MPGWFSATEIILIKNEERQYYVVSYDTICAEKLLLYQRISVSEKFVRAGCMLREVNKA